MLLVLTDKNYLFKRELCWGNKAKWKMRIYKFMSFKQMKYLKSGEVSLYEMKLW